MIASPPAPMPMSEFAAEMLSHYATLCRSLSTISSAGQVLNELVELTGVQSTGDLDDDAIRRFIDRQPPGQSPHTLQRKLRTIRAACNHARRLGLIAAAPRVPLIAKPKAVDAEARRPLAREEVERVLDHLQRGSYTWEGGRLFVLAFTAAHTDLLKRELLELRWEDCDLDRATIRIRRREEILRSSRSPIARIPENLLPVLAAWRPRSDRVWVFPNKTRSNYWASGPPGTKPVQQLAAAGRAVGVAGFTFDALHRFFLEHAAPGIGLEPVPMPARAGIAPQPTPQDSQSIGIDQQHVAPTTAVADRPPPRRRHTEVRDITIAAATRLLVHLLRGSATWEGHRLYALVAVVLFAGLRQAQALGLRWEDCDLEGRTLRIGRRAIPHHLAAEAAQVLAEWRAREDLGGSDWVFPGTLLVGPWWGGRPGQKPLERLRAAAEDAGIGHVTFDALRHLWLSCAGRVVLGEEFRSLRPPERIADGPQARRPGPRPVLGGPARTRGPRAYREAREARMVGAVSRPPDIATPVPPAADPETTIPVKFGPGNQITVLGRPKELSKAGRRVIKALQEAGRDGMRPTQFQTVCGDGRGIVKRLIGSDPDWAAVIHRDMCGDRVKRYWIGPPRSDESNQRLSNPHNPGPNPHFFPREVAPD
jgi:integrase